jgi:carboxyl-terminal processing protease
VRTRLRVLLVGVLLTAACGGGGSPATPTQPGASTQQVQTYLGQMVDVMQANSLHRLTINWTDFRSRVLAQSVGAQTLVDARPAIRLALQLLGDGHSSYRTIDGAVLFVANRTCSAGDPGVGEIPSDIGYVKVAAFSGSAGEATAFARGIQDAIARADSDALVGWIVDLRGNGGGNMWPMIAGLGPVLGEGPAGFFIDPLGGEIEWAYENGSSRIGGIFQVGVPGPYRLRREQPRVAVLSDNPIASSGEAALISFRGRPGARSFGTATCGLSTSNRGFTLSDSALLNLTVSVMADRHRTKYGDSIAPDEVVADPGQVVPRAIAWLRTGSGLTTAAR